MHRLAYPLASLFAVLALLLVLSGCAAPRASAPQVPKTRIEDTACSWVKPLTASPADTIDTKRQILAHDLALSKNCPKVSP